MPDPAASHFAEQQYAAASAHLDAVLDNVRKDTDLVAVCTETRDPSALFDYVYSILVTKNRIEPGSFRFCEVICAAALVRLALTPKTADPLEDLLNDQ